VGNADNNKPGHKQDDIWSLPVGNLELFPSVVVAKKESRLFFGLASSKK
jgi:hypothetical protein